MIGIGVIGTGFARTTQIPGFRACEGARVLAIASAHREHAAKVAHKFGIEHVAGDWRELIARDDIDLISVVTPPVTHMEMSLLALDGGKTVLCEKPMAMNAGEADAMRRRASEKNAFALIDHELRFLPARRKMREMLRSGQVGRLYHVKLTYRADSRANAERPWNWWSDLEQGGGVLGAIGSHVIDGFRWLLGVEISHVFGRLATHVTERPDQRTGQMRPVTTDDEANLLLRFSDSELTKGTTGAVSLSMVESGRAEHRLELFGSRGALMIEGGELWHSQTGAGEWSRIEVERGDLAPGMHDNEWARGFTAFSRAIIEALREGRSGVEGAATFEDGYRTQVVLDAARRSHETGCWTRVKDFGFEI